MSALDLPTVLRILLTQGDGLSTAAPDTLPRPVLPDVGGAMDLAQTRMDLTGSPFAGVPPLAPVNEPPRATAPPGRLAEILNAIATGINAHPLSARPTGTSTQNNAAGFLAGFGNTFSAARGVEMGKADAMDEALKVEAAKRNERNLKASEYARELARMRWDKRMEAKQRVADEKDLLAFKSGLEPDEATKGRNEALRLAARNAELRARGERIPGEGGAGAGDAVEGDILLSPQAIDMAALMYLKTGQLGSEGMGKYGVRNRNMIRNRAAELGPNVDLATNKVMFSGLQRSLTQLRVISNAAKAFQRTAGANAKIVRDLALRVPDTGIRAVNGLVRPALSMLGDPAVAAFEASLKPVQAEYARIMDSPTLAGQLTDDAKKQMRAVIGGDFTRDQLLGSLAVFEMDSDNRIGSYDQSIRELEQQLRDLGPKKPSASETLRFTDGAGKFWNIPASDTAAVARARAKLTEVPVGR